MVMAVTNGEVSNMLLQVIISSLEVKNQMLLLAQQPPSHTTTSTTSIKILNLRWIAFQYNSKISKMREINKKEKTKPILVVEMTGGGDREGGNGRSVGVSGRFFVLPYWSPLISAPSNLSLITRANILLNWKKYYNFQGWK